jgi:hypothetical protein
VKPFYLFESVTKSIYDIEVEPVIDKELQNPDKLPVS